MKNIFDEVRVLHVDEDLIRIEFVYNNSSILNTLRYNNKFNETWCSDNKQVFVPANEKDFIKALSKSVIDNQIIKASRYYKGAVLSMDSKTHRIPYVKYEEISVEELIDIASKKFCDDCKNEEQNFGF